MNRSIDQVKMHNDLFIEMLEVYCHSILYLRGVYRAEVFRKRKVYNTAVYISISPMLNDYLTGCCKTAKELKGKNVLKRAELIIFEKQIDENSQELQNELEKYVFVVTDTPQISFDLTAHLLNMEEQLRRGLIDLEQSTKRLPKLDAPNCGFRIELGIDKTAYNEIVNSGNERSENFSWVAVKDNGKTRPDSDAKLWKILPVFDTTAFNLSVITPKGQAGAQ